ncbi:hypothetical protein AAFX91_36950 [Bradyrhizobium sp. 31Argb]|uniref:hypothetical protein n=1 Tax=Bradyrhizobium sp. 31Argb TaxID=3141247 RepID=UPI003748611E
MLSTDLKRLHDTFEGWSRGQPFPTIDAWIQFGRDLKSTIARAALLELGVDVRVLDLENEAPAADGKIVYLHKRRPVLVPIGNGDGK